MSVVHKATLKPTKSEMFAAWVAARPWAAMLGEVGDRIGSYRFDDPAGRVGIECALVPVGGSVVQIPVTYRDAPLDGAADHLVTTLEHSALGTRWVYDACADPVAIQVLLRAVLGGAGQEPMDVYDGDTFVRRLEPVVTARGTGTSRFERDPEPLDDVTIRSMDADAVIEADGFTIIVKRVVDGHDAPGSAHLEVAWPGGSGRLVGVGSL